MLFGHNTDVKFGVNVYHVQTEDRGTATALIETTVYCKGQVLHRRTNKYEDLLPLDGDRESLLRKRIDEQHAAVMQDVRAGVFPVPAAPAVPKANSRSKSVADNSATELCLELLNAKTWLNGKHAHLHIAVRQQQNGVAVVGAKIVLRLDGSAEPAAFSTQTGADGTAQLDFDMPQLAAAELVLLFEATHGIARGQLKFQLRSKPRAREVV